MLNVVSYLQSNWDDNSKEYESKENIIEKEIIKTRNGEHINKESEDSENKNVADIESEKQKPDSENEKEKAYSENENEEKNIEK